MLKPTVNSQTYNCAAFRAMSQSIAECRFAQSSDITEIIAVSPQVSCVMAEASSGRVNYSGRLVLSIVYADEEGKLCRMQKGAEFSHSADDERLTPSHNCVCRLSCDKLTVRRDGSSFVVACVITADITAFERRERTYVSAAEGAFVNLRRVKLCSDVTFSGESEVEDNFDADSVEDVLIPSAKAIVTEVVCGTGETEVSGEIYLALFAMRGQSPASLERVIPFRCVLPCDDSSVGKQASANVEITDLNVAATVNEERGKCEVDFTCTLAFNGIIYDYIEDDVATDAFASACELELTRQSESFTECEGIKVYSQRVSGAAAAKSRLGYDCKFLAVALPEAECEYVPSSGAAEGVVRALLIYEQGGEIKSTEFSLPFSERLAGLADDGQSVAISAAVSGVSLRLRAEGETEAEAVVKICATVTRQRSTEYITSLTEGKEKTAVKSAVSVLFPEIGDGLWDISKKLSESPDEVAARNPQLKYPLTGKERIVVYRGGAQLK